VVGSLLGKSAVVRDPAAAELSERETDVVRLIAQGYSNKEIATLLNLSVKTVETYKARAMEKIGGVRAGIRVQPDGRESMVFEITADSWLGNPKLDESCI